MSVPTRIYAVGDVHGRYDLFRRLMAAIRQDQQARGPATTEIVLLGDIVDRGPDSAAMVVGCRKLSGLSGRFRVLKGNHEAMMVQALGGDLRQYRDWLQFGGRQTLLSWGVDAEVVQDPPTAAKLRAAARAVGGDVLAWLARLPLYHRHGDHLFVHAGVRPDVAMDEQDPLDLLWITTEFLASDADFGAIVVHGHSIREEGPDIRPNRIGLDTGAYRTGRLTAMGIEGGETWFLTATADDADTLPPERAHVRDGGRASPRAAAGSLQ